MGKPRKSPESRKLSVIVLARNEATVLAQTLASVAPIADEILVVDTGSTDQTAAIARQHGARVIEHAWTDDFAAARNTGLAAASCVWVLWIDAGEHLDPECAGTLRSVIDTAADAARAYWLWVDVPPSAPGLPAEQVARLRLMPRYPGLRYVGAVAETVEPALEADGIGTTLLPLRISRTAREHDAWFKQTRAQRNLNILDRHASAGDTVCDTAAKQHLVRGEAYLALGNVKAAIEHLRSAIAEAPLASSTMLEAYYGSLAALDLVPSALGEQIALCLRGLEVFPLDVQLLLAMGSYLQAQGRLDLAARSFETAVQFGQVQAEIWHRSDLGETAALMLAGIYTQLGKPAEALAVLTDAISRFPEHAGLRRGAMETAAVAGDQDMALAHLEHMALSDDEQNMMRSVLRGASQAAHKRWTTALAYLEPAYGSGCRETLCLRPLALSLIAANRLPAAGDVLAAWCEAEPDNSEPAEMLRTLSASIKKPPAADGQSRLVRIETGGNGAPIAPTPAAGPFSPDAYINRL